MGASHCTSAPARTNRACQGDYIQLNHRKNKLYNETIYKEELMETELVQISVSPKLPVQVAKVVVSAIAGFVGAKLGEKGFDAAMNAFQNRKA